MSDIDKLFDLLFLTVKDIESDDIEDEQEITNNENTVISDNLKNQRKKPVKFHDEFIKFRKKKKGLTLIKQPRTSYKSGDDKYFLRTTKKIEVTHSS